VYKISYDGKDYFGKADELTALRAAIGAAILQDAFPPLENKAQMWSGYYADLQRLHDDQYVIAFFVETLGGTDLGPVAQAVNAQAGAISAAKATISADPASGEQSLRAAVDAVNAAGTAVTDYVDSIDTGGSRTIAVLTVVEVGCFAVAGAAGGAALVAGGMGTVGAAALSGAGFSALQSLANDGAHNLIMDDKGVSAGDIVEHALVSAVLGGVGAAAGSAVAGKAAPMVVDEVMAQAGAKVARAEVEAAVKNAISSTVQTVVTSAPDLARGKMTWGEFAKRLAMAMIAGWAAGKIVGAPRGMGPEDTGGNPPDNTGQPPENAGDNTQDNTGQDNQTPDQANDEGGEDTAGAPEPADTTVPGPRTVTASEYGQLQAIANRFNTRIEIVGSRGAGLGRNVETTLPTEGKGDGTRSDIDVVIDGQKDIDTGGALSEAIRNSCGGITQVASVSGAAHGPHITIEPQSGGTSSATSDSEPPATVRTPRGG
jgi:hypothetical protein